MSYVGKVAQDGLLGGLANANGGIFTPKLFCYPSSPFIANVTGDGTSFIPICDTVDFDLDGAYNVATGVYTASKDGYFFVCASVSLINLTGVNDLANLGLTTSAGLQTLTSVNPSVEMSSTSTFTDGLQTIVKLLVGETLQFNVSASGGGLTVGYRGYDSGIYTFFSVAEIA